MIREQAIKILNKYDLNFCDINGNPIPTQDLAEAVYMAVQALEQEPIIYCKDCKYWQDNNNGYPVTDCRWNKDETPDADDYCSFAERKDQ